MKLQPPLLSPQSGFPAAGHAAARPLAELEQWLQIRVGKDSIFRKESPATSIISQKVEINDEELKD